MIDGRSAAEFVPSSNNGSYYDDTYVTQQQNITVTQADLASQSQTIDSTGSELYIPEGGFAQLATVGVDQTQRHGVCTVAFDQFEELLWAGTTGGHITSYYGAGVEKYTSFQTTADGSDVRSLVSTDVGLLSLSRQSLRCHKRTGLPLFNHTSSNLCDMQCMLLMSQPSGSLLMGGYQNSLVQLDLTTMNETRVVKTETDATILRSNDKFFLSGDTTGNVVLRSLKSLDTIHKMEAHKGSLSDFDVSGSNLVTCGFSLRMGQLSCDRFLMMYDLRTLRALPPISLGFEPFFIRFLPTYSDRRIVVASQAGEFQVFEIGENGHPYQVDTQGMPLFCLDVSSTKQAIAFGDGAGFLHLFSDRIEPVFNVNSLPTEFADPVTPIPQISLQDNLAPLSVIPAPFPCDGQWLSDWPEDLCRRIYRKPVPIDPEILRSMRLSQFVGYASNPGNRRRNQVPYDLTVSNTTHNSNSNHSGTLPASRLPLESPSGRTTDPLGTVPKLYRKVRIKPSKFGSEDFNYGHYNKTNFSGIECHIPNAYCHAVILALYHLKPVRSLMLSHLCRKEACLACELSFVFKMIDQNAGRQPCMINNFIRAFKMIPEATALGLVFNDKDDNELQGVNLGAKIESFNRFLLQQLETEFEMLPAKVGHSTGSTYESGESQFETDNSMSNVGQSMDADNSAFCSMGQTSVQEAALTSKSDSHNSNLLRSLFGSYVHTVNRCKCEFESNQSGSSLVVSLSYPQGLDGPSTFNSILSNSLNLEQVMHTFCERCSKYTPSMQKRHFTDLSDVLVISTNIATDKDKEFLFRQQTFFESEQPPSVLKSSVTERPRQPCRYGPDCKRPNCRYSHTKDTQESEAINQTRQTHWIQSCVIIGKNEQNEMVVDDEANSNQSLTEKVKYELGSVIFLVAEQDMPHLITCVCCDSDWIVFNEFVVSKVSVDEVLYFNMDWKVPCLLFYAREDLTKRHNVEERRLVVLEIVHLDESVFWGEESLAARRRLSSFTFVPLEKYEIPGKGDIVAIDAEFVTINQEETELRSDGTKAMIKPSQMSLARVTCIRGSNNMKFTPFIDDYISAQDEVVDYLTKFSGIKPGDLDPSVSTKHLTTLKWTYLKLQYLVDSGVIFVGHGLSNDFRVINIVVPKEQIRDTVHLFHLPHNRMISLRFLAWYFLGLKIQSDTHDSVEDARTAMKLYDKYQQLRANGLTEVAKAISDLYEKGRQLHWEVPPDD